MSTWDRVKQQEKSGAVAGGLLESVPRATPGLVEARRLGSRAAKVGFDWPNADGLFEKLAEETAEVRAELAADRPDADRVEEEIGDLLFTAVNLARHLKVDPEQALKKANAKFRARFAAMEAAADNANILHSRTSEEWEVLWHEAKGAEISS